MAELQLKTCLSTFLLVLIVIGYQIVTTVFLPGYYAEGTEGGVTVSRLVTVPYRAIVLGIAIAIIILNWHQRINWRMPIKLFLFFWILLSIRIIFDFEFRTDIIVDPSVVQNHYIYTYLVCLIPALAVLVSVRYIDFDMAFKWLIGGHILFVFLYAYQTPTLFSTFSSEVRSAGSMALNPIAFGQTGATLSVLCLCWLLKTSEQWQKIVAGLFICIGILIIFSSGSRGPLLALIGSSLFYVIARQQSPLWLILLLLVLGIFFYLLSDIIFDAIGSISPIMASRLTPTGNVNQYADLTTGRTELYQSAIEKFLEHPLWGDGHALFYPDGTIWYSHNMVLDAFMGLGLFGGVLFVVVLTFVVWNSYQMIHNHYKYSWIGVLCICYVIRHMFSGTFYHADALNALLVMVLVSTETLSYSKYH